jgi:GT2 family glycosyltransferase
VVEIQVADPLVVIVAYRADEHLLDCLAALGSDFRVIVVDNSPTNVSESIARQAGAGYRASERNVGFASAVNLGLAEAWDGHRDVLLLNPDARATRTDVLALVSDLHRVPRRAAVGPLLVDDLGRSQLADWPLPTPSQIWLDALGLGRLWRGRRFVVGAVLLLSGEALADIGGLDERYFLYAEEADWQLRAQRAGWTVAVTPTVTVAHVGGASSGDPDVRDALFHASQEAFARKWYGNAGWTLARLGSIVAAIRRSVTGSAADRATGRRTLRLYRRGPAQSAQAVRRTAG